MTRNVCSKMFTDLNIKFPNNIVKNCCKSNDYIMSAEEVSVDNMLLMNNEYVRRKSSMLFDDKLPKRGCDTCLNVGTGNSLFTSWNIWKINDFNEERDNKLLTDENFSTFEFMLSSACDLKCVYCHPKDSSSWAKEMGVPVYKGSDTWKETVLSQLYELLEKKEFDPKIHYFFFFSGGEPTYNPETIVMIQRMLEILSVKNCRASFVISTNANTKEKVLDKYIELVRNYPRIEWVFDCSLDGIGEVCEAIRYGIVWDRAIQNIERLSKEFNVKIRISPTVNLYSIPTMEEFVSFFIDLIKKNGRVTPDLFNFNMTQETPMSPASLPDEYKKYLDKPIEICKNNGVFYFKHLQNVREIIGTNHNKDSTEKVKKQFQYFKEKRPDTDWDALFPHIVKLIGE